MGNCPDDWRLFQAARYLGVAPWELAEQPIYYMERALLFLAAEGESLHVTVSRME